MYSVEFYSAAVSLQVPAPGRLISLRIMSNRLIRLLQEHGTVQEN